MLDTLPSVLAACFWSVNFKSGKKNSLKEVARNQGSQVPPQQTSLTLEPLSLNHQPQTHSQAHRTPTKGPKSHITLYHVVLYTHLEFLD